MAEQNQEEQLRVSDLIPFNEESYQEILSTIEVLSALTEDYRNTYHLEKLETIKREFNAYLERFAVLYSQTKAYKGDTHTYLSEHRKRFKGETMKILLDEGYNSTSADKIVYSHPYYVKRLNLLEDITEFFIRTEELYTRFNYTLQCIVQSISVASKEKTNTKTAG